MGYSTVRRIMREGLTDPRNLDGIALWNSTRDVTDLTTDTGIKLWADKSGNSSTNVLVMGSGTGNRCSLTTGTAIGTGDFTISGTFIVPPTAVTAGINSLSASATTNNQARAFYMETRATGDIWFTLIGATTADFRSLRVASIQSTYANQLATVTFTRTGTTVAAYVTVAGVTATLSGSETTGGTPPAWSDTVTSTSTNIGFNATTEVMAGPMYYAAVYSAVLNAAGIIANAAGTVQSNNVVFVDFTQQTKLDDSFTATSGQTVTITTSGATGARISGARDLYQGTAANQPIYLPWSGANYGYLNGVSGNYFSTPDSGAVSITGDIDIRCYAALDSWSPGGNQIFLGKDDVGTNRDYAFYTNSTGSNLSFFYSTDGSTLTGRIAVSSVGTGFAAYSANWVRVTYASATGKVNFYTSADGVSWSALGTEQTITAGAIHDGNQPLGIGAGSAGGLRLVGRIYRAQIYNGIAGTLAFDFNPAAYTSGTTFLDSSSNAATITINGGANIVTSTRLYFDGSNDYLKAAAFALNQPETVYLVGSQISWTSTDRMIDGNVGGSMMIRQVVGSPQIGIGAGSSINGASLAIGTNGVITGVFNGASSLLRINRGTALTGDVGAANGGGLTLGAANDGNLSANITAQEVLVYSTAQDENYQYRVTRLLSRRTGVLVA